MKRLSLILFLALFVILLALEGAPTTAQAPGENLRAPRPDPVETQNLASHASLASLPTLPGLEGFTTLLPQWGSSWQDQPASPFALSRFDGAYSHKHNMVFFLGGRLADGTTDGSVWVLNSGGVYADTGVDLVTPVANYTINLLEDANGIGLYILCGRTVAASFTGSVQIYYPDTNTAVQLGPEDNYPGSGTCTAAMNVVHNNKVYVAGGFDSLLPPYNWGETWVFDPLAPAGSRWTQIASANLSQPRAYIMGALVDDRLYAIGGSLYDPTYAYCGEMLCNLPIVEVLDLSDPVPTWSDAAAADLPEGCSEGRAFGFDSTSQFKDVDGTPFAGRIVATCGGWSVESERVYAYSTRANHWDAFPSLNRTRRGQAAEFIPASYAGVGAMLNWGGRSGSDANILNIPESYLVAASGCSVLLVDDDWDFDPEAGENNGGRAYYASALNYLGYPWTVWDTVTQGVPSAATMSAYDIVVWFTGYDWQDPVTADEETALVAYLNAGGNLFMSSQDLAYAEQGLTLRTSYFGISSITPDVNLRSVSGSPTDSLYASLGSYTLRRPDDLVAYWPTGFGEGPYDDALVAASNAFEPLRYTDSGAASASRFQGATFKTVYLGFPMEWVDTIQERAQILGTALKWMCPIPEPIYLPLLLK